MKSDPSRVTYPCHTKDSREPVPRVLVGGRRGSRSELRLGRSEVRTDGGEKLKTVTLPRPSPQKVFVAQGRSRSADRQQVGSSQNVNKSEDNLGHGSGSSSCGTLLHNSTRLISNKRNAGTFTCSASSAPLQPQSGQFQQSSRMKSSREKSSSGKVVELVGESGDRRPQASLSLPVIGNAGKGANSKIAECANCSGKWRNETDPKDMKKVITLWQNYYPEGQWGWIIVTSAFLVQCIAHGSQLAYSFLSIAIDRKFNVANPLHLGTFSYYFAFPHFLQ
ncbi:unnamed protein product [Allacma fusca]|uniref:Uncharacterized protein n=1 Tax=Allacma fusca TaxID=39272 RepID=A0A8J2PG81_9HEXA|nr:unnamed protein product [Allacma fusca]